MAARDQAPSGRGPALAEPTPTGARGQSPQATVCAAVCAGLAAVGHGYALHVAFCRGHPLVWIVRSCDGMRTSPVVVHCDIRLPRPLAVTRPCDLQIVVVALLRSIHTPQPHTSLRECRPARRVVVVVVPGPHLYG